MVSDNEITNMQDAGIALLETMNADIYDNTIDGAQFGIRMSLGSAGNYVHDNSFNDCEDCELDCTLRGFSESSRYYSTRGRCFYGRFYFCYTNVKHVSVS